MYKQGIENFYSVKNIISPRAHNCARGFQRVNRTDNGKSFPPHSLGPYKECTLLKDIYYMFSSRHHVGACAACTHTHNREGKCHCLVSFVGVSVRLSW